MSNLEDELQRMEDMSATTTNRLPDEAQLCASDVFKSGQIVAGRYRIISIIGRGGMGLVYRVEQIFLNREYALKTIETQNITEVAIRRFQHEGRAASLLDHPNLIKVHDFGLLDNDTPFFVMDFLTGPTLSMLIKQRGCLPVSEAAPLFMKLCFALRHAHQQQIVHRDIKPGNIMFAEDTGLASEVKIVDFGIAKIAQAEDVQAMTRTGEVFGSPLYMSPEQCAGAPVDHRADIYALGCVFFEVLTGTPPFIGQSTLSTMMKHQNETIPSLKEGSLGMEFPEALERIVARMLAKDAAERYQDLGIVAKELAQLTDGGAVTVELDAKKSTAAGAPDQSTQMQISSENLLRCIGVTSIGSMIAGFLLAAAIPMPEIVRPPKVGFIGESINIKHMIMPKADYRVDDNGNRLHSFVFGSRLPALVCDLATGRTVEARGIVELPADHQIGLILKSDDLFRTNPDLLLGIRKDQLQYLALDGTRKTITAPKISHLKALTGVDFEDVSVNDEMIRQLDKLPLLNHLGLKRCQGMTLERLCELKRLNDLRDVCLDGWKELRPILKILQGSRSLQTISLQDCGLDDYDISLIAGFRELRVLKITHNVGIAKPSSIKKLARAKTLQDLRLDVPPFSMDLVNALAELKQLKTLTVLSVIKPWRPEEVRVLKESLPHCDVQFYANEKRPSEITDDIVNEFEKGFEKWSASDLKPPQSAP